MQKHVIECKSSGFSNKIAMYRMQAKPSWVEQCLSEDVVTVAVSDNMTVLWVLGLVIDFIHFIQHLFWPRMC